MYVIWKKKTLRNEMNEIKFANFSKEAALVSQIDES